MVRPGFKQTEVGVIPEDWEVSRLGDLGQIVRGGSPRPAGDLRYFDGDFIPWLTVASLTNIPVEQQYIVDTKTKLTQEGSKRSRNLSSGTLAIVNSGARTLGVSKILSIEACANDGIAALVNQTAGNKEFICYYLNSQITRLREVIASGNDQLNLNTTRIAAIFLPFPSEIEQRAIAGALAAVDAALAGVLGVIAKKADLKQAAMQTLLTGQTRLPGFAGDWEITSFASLVSHHAGNSALIKGRLSPIPRVDLFPGFSASGQDVWCDTYEHEGNAIIVSAVGSRCGKAFQATGRWSAIANTHVVWPNEEIVDLQFLNLFLNDEEFWQKSGTGQPFVLFRQTFMQTIALPTKAEQAAIAVVLSDMDAEIGALVAQAEKTRLLKQAMMQELLTGRTRLPLSEVSNA